MKKIFLLFFISALSINLFSQEALKSTEEEYYDFLSLQGLTDRQYLNYRTLSDSVWVIRTRNKINQLYDLRIKSKCSTKSFWTRMV